MAAELFDVPEFLASLADDDELARELVVAFLEDSPRRKAALGSALEAGDALEVSKLAHSLKGMCGVVHAHALSELAMEMEYAARSGNLDLVRARHDELKDLFGQVCSLMRRFLEDG